jgi:hypothetical protein
MDKDAGSSTVVIKLMMMPPTTTPTTPTTLPPPTTPPPPPLPTSHFLYTFPAITISSGLFICASSFI